MKNEMNDFLEYCEVEKRLSPKSLKAYRIDLNQFTNYCRINHIHEINEISYEHLRSYLNDLNSKYKPATIKRKIATLKALSSYCNHMDAKFNFPIHKLKVSLKKYQTLPRIIPSEICELFFRSLYNKKSELKNTNNQYKNILRDILAIELLFTLGIRVSELSNLKLSDISLSFETVKIKGKGNKERIIPIYNNQIKKIYNEYLPYRNHQNDFLIQNRVGERFSPQSIRFMIRKHITESEIPMKITPHMFRHTIATLLLENELDIRYIQHFLGHSSITTTEIYTHVTAKRYSEQIINKHPRRFFNEG